MPDGSALFHHFQADAPPPPASFRPLWPDPPAAAGFQPLRPQDLATLPDAAPPPAVPEPEPEPETPRPAPPPPTAAIADQPSPEPPPPALTQTDLDRAMEEGRRLGRAEAEAALAAETSRLEPQALALAQAIAALSRPRPEDVAALSAQIDAAVAGMASARAGQAIDAAPAPFARRIAELADQVVQTQAALALHLNPDDLAAIRPLLEGACPAPLAALAQARLVPDPSLARGDVDLRGTGVRIADTCPSNVAA